MNDPFDPATYQPQYRALAGFALAHGLPLARFEALLDQATLAAIDARLVGIPEAADWRVHLVYDACWARYGSFGRVVEALGDF
jgi:hypothetical protein